MDNFKVIYKVLKYLEIAMDLDVVDRDEISHEKFGISEARWSRLIEMMYDNGYIDGVHIINYCGGESYPSIKFDNLRITLAGLEYLEENSVMQKAKNFFKDIKETVPGL